MPLKLAGSMKEEHARGHVQGNQAGPRRGVKLAALALGVTLAFATFEVSLRLVPGIISPKALILFEPDLRADIAAGSYALQKDFREVERDDGGPPLFVPKPESPIVSIDAAEDGSERSTDEIGFCNPPGRYAGRERIDVIALGDSFSWCHAVRPEQAWPALVGERTGLSTYSLGLGGKGLYEYVQLLREFGIPKRPRVVIMNVYGGNDLRDGVVYRDYRAAVERGEPPPSDEPENIAPGLVSSAIGRRSYALNFVVAWLSRLAHTDPSKLEKVGIDLRYDVLLSAGEVKFNTENRDRDEIAVARRLESGAAPLTIWDGALERLVALAREHSFAAVVSYTPAAYSAYHGSVRLADPSLAPLLVRFDEAQRRHLSERSASLGLLFLDLTPRLREAAAHTDASGLMYGPVHVHLSARGNEVVAQALASFLAEKGLASSATP
ncbi:MAG: SGNH/GDSL hydrolase family protein [Candidatus Binatia bacterium]